MLTFKEERAMWYRFLEVFGRSAVGLAVLAVCACTAMAQESAPRTLDAPGGVRRLDAVEDAPVGKAGRSVVPAVGDTPGVPTRATRRGPAPSGPAENVTDKKAEGADAAREPAADGGAAASVPPAAAPATPPPTAAAPDAPATGDKKQGKLEPIPEAKSAGPVELETTSFKGVTPGTTTLAEVQKSWGKPKEIKKQEHATIHLYSVDPFPRVELNCVGDKVASIVIRFEKPFPTGAVAQQLDLAKIQPVLVSSELGEILGQAYPERGILFSFEPSQTPGKVPAKVTHIILEPLTSEPFTLRAETNLDTRPEFSLHDLDEALKLQPANARAHWLRSRVLSSLGEHEKAAAASSEAVRYEPNDARFHATNALLLGQVGRVQEAAASAQKAHDLSQQRPHVRARALCLLGDLAGSGAKPDFKQALAYHTQALQAADPLTSSKHPAIRVAAKEVLVDAHLGAAHDIAWGAYQQKDRAVETWLGKAENFAEDLIKSEGGGDEYRFRVSTRGLAALVGLKGTLDPERWVKELVRSGNAMVDATVDAARQAQLRWEVGMALYDALQIYQMRSDQKTAMKCGELAIEYIEKSGRQSQSPANSYLLGRLYFRLGATHSVDDKDHRAAVPWFDKAVELLGKSYPREVLGDLGRHGETFVCMGVSYWETGQREKAVKLTEHGLGFMEDAASQGALDKSALSVPYGNLASMHRQLGQGDKAERFEEMASRNKGTKAR
jgi:tetratricopeptide (TPR) repeat protein